MEEWQISLARSAAGAGGHENPTFHVGGVTDLPFEDDSFDAAHCHAVLMHVLDTQAVLAEVKRILKPGGIISSREMQVGVLQTPLIRDGRSLVIAIGSVASEGGFGSFRRGTNRGRDCHGFLRAALGGSSLLLSRLARGLDGPLNKRSAGRYGRR